MRKDWKAAGKEVVKEVAKRALRTAVDDGLLAGGHVALSEGLRAAASVVRATPLDLSHFDLEAFLSGDSVRGIENAVEWARENIYERLMTEADAATARKGTRR